MPSSVGPMRRRAVAFAQSVGASGELTDAVGLAVSETVTNVVIHAYVGQEPGRVSVRCQGAGERMIVEVIDDGVGVAARRDSPGSRSRLGARRRTGADARGRAQVRRPGHRRDDVVRWHVPAPELSGLESLCRLAVEHVADASCLDVVGEGVLRRVTAEVAGDAEATAWLRGALPPAKPGTATWAALREGGARLVVHDPSVARSPGGAGERLGLAWWVSVPLEGPDGAPMALWGFGGRLGRRPIPSEDVLRALADAGRSDLTQESQQAALRARLALG